MPIEEIKKNFNFIYTCTKYGLKIDEAQVFEDIIVVPTVKKGTYFFMNTNYEIIEIYNQRDEASMEVLSDLAHKCKAKYEFKESESGSNYPYPFENLSMKDIMDLGRRIKVEADEFDKYVIYIDGIRIENDHSQTYLNVLSYIKFIYDNVTDYPRYAFKASMMSYSHPSISNYAYRLMESINVIIEEKANAGEPCRPKDVMAYIGESSNSLENYYEILHMIELVAKKLGYQFTGDVEEPVKRVKPVISYDPKDVMHLLDLKNDVEGKSIDDILLYITIKKLSKGEPLLDYSGSDFSLADLSQFCEDEIRIKLDENGMPASMERIASGALTPDKIKHAQVSHYGLGMSSYLPLFPIRPRRYVTDIPQEAYDMENLSDVDLETGEQISGDTPAGLR